MKGNNHINDLNEIGGILTGLGDRLNVFAANSEHTFLRIGSKLNNYQSTVRTLLNISSSAAQNISEEIIKKGIADLDNFLIQFGNYLSKSASEISSDKNILLKIVGLIDAILEESAIYFKIVKRLKMLGISTKIESVRLGSDNQGFFILAESVDRLSSTINDKATLIKNKAGFISNEISNTTGDLEKLRKTQEERAKTLLETTSHSIEVFKTKYNQCFEKAGKINNIISSVGKAINKVVTSIQFHDITRQQIEHVSQVLIDNGNKLIKKLSGDPAEILSPDDVGSIYDACQLQNMQLNHSDREFSDAVENIISNLKNIGGDIGNVLNETCYLLEDSDSAAGNSLASFQKELGVIISELNKNLKIGDDLTNSIQSVIHVVSELAGYIKEIDEIGSEIELIALNARVKAAKTGEEGASLGVLAEAIQKLSIDAKTHTITTTEMLTQVEKISDRLKSSTEGFSKEESRVNISGLGEKITGLLKSISRIENETADSIADLKTQVANLQTDISRTTEEINIHKEFNGTVINSTGILEDVFASLERTGMLKSDRKIHTKNISLKYTMASERDIHENFLDLKNNSNGNGVKKNITGGDDSLGDNIELF